MTIGGDVIARIVDRYGNFLLHGASASRLSRTMIRRIFRLHPYAVIKVSVINCLPLHSACVWKSLSAAESLAAAYPAALSRKNKEGKTPFESIGDGRGIIMTEDEKLLFKRAILRNCLKEYCRMDTLLDYGTEIEVSILIESDHTEVCFI